MPSAALAASMTPDPRIALIAAVARNGVIGRDNRLPWRLPADLAHFKRLTLGKPLLMGRRTFESLPGPLPGRAHIVVTANADFRPAGAVRVATPDAGLLAAGPAEEIMVIGGARLYASLLPLAARLYLTRVEADVDGDAVFPAWDPDDWREVARETRPRDAANRHDLTFLTYERHGAAGPPRSSYSAAPGWGRR